MRRSLASRCLSGGSSCRLIKDLATGVVYYAFSRDHNVRPIEYSWRLSLLWSLDFYIDPMCSVIGQRLGNEVYILDELVLPNSNTNAA